MIAATVDGVLCWLLTEEPDWDTAPKVDFASATGRDQGLTGREARVRLASATEATLAQRWLPVGGDAFAFARAIESHDNRPVLVPFWPAAGLLSEIAASPWGDGLRVFFEPDWSAWQIRAGAQAPTSFAPTAACLTAPLAWSRFDKLPAAQLLTPRVHEIDVTTVETGSAAYALAPRPLVFATGPSAGGTARPVLPLVPDWASEPQQAAEIRINRKKLGHARGQAEEYYSQIPRRTFRATFRLNAVEAATLVEFYRQAGGMARPWWSPCWEEYTYLAAPATGAQIVVEAGDRLADCAAVALVSPAGAIAVRAVVGRDGNTLTLDSAPSGFPIDTAVTPALLCRFAAEKLSVRFSTPTNATASVDITSLPAEAADSIGDEGGSAALLVVTDGANTWLWTDHDAPVDAGSLGVFEPRHFELGEFTEELNLEAHEGSIEIRAWSGCPLLRLVEESESYELWVTAYECDPEVADSAEWLFTGRARLSKATGPFLSVSLGGFESILDTKGPRQLMQDTCCAAYGDAKCTKVLSALGVAAVSSTSAQLDLVLPDPAPTVASYAYGFAERTLGPGRVQRWTIRSAAIVDTVLRLQLDGAVHPAVVEGESWDLYTGCPGTWAACQERGNTENFRAFPYTPTRNPSIVPVTTTTGGKK